MSSVRYYYAYPLQSKCWILYNNDTMKRKTALVKFLEETMVHRKRLASQLAADIGVSHATMSRWLSGKDIPGMKSCRRLAEYSGVPTEKVLAIAGHLPSVETSAPLEWPEFREYAMKKYPDDLDEDTIEMIEHLLDRRRGKRLGKS